MDRVLEIIKKYETRMPPTAYFELLADIQNIEPECKEEDNSVLVDIKAEMIRDSFFAKLDGDKIYKIIMFEDAMTILDSHISGKENT